MRWIFLSEWSRHPSDWFLNACRPMRTMRVYQGVFRTLLHYACIPRRDIYSSTTMYVWGNLPPVAQWRDQCSAFHKEPLCCWIVLGRYYSSWNANTSTTKCMAKLRGSLIYFSILPSRTLPSSTPTAALLSFSLSFSVQRTFDSSIKCRIFNAKSWSGMYPIL